MLENTLYRGSHRQNLDDDSDIQALEAERNRGTTEEPNPEDDASLNPEEQTFKKRYGDLRRYMQDRDAKFNNTIAQLQRQLEEATRKQIQLPKSKEEIEQWANEYPDVAKIIESIAIQKADERFKEAEVRLKKVDELERKTAQERAELELKRLHPDYFEISQDPEFHAWAKEQPEYIQHALYVNDTDARACARAIDLYKADKGIAKTVAKPKPKRDDSAADYVPKGQRSQVPDRHDGKKIWKESEIGKLNARQYDALEDELMLARKEGRIDYDVSGGSM